MAHKHAHLIRAWADGAQIQVFVQRSNQWKNTSKPSWSSNKQYRIKPEHEPVWEMCVVYERGEVVSKMSGRPNLRLTFDVNTSNLLAAKVLK